MTYRNSDNNRKRCVCSLWASALLTIALMMCQTLAMAQTSNEWEFSTLPPDGVIAESKREVIGWGYSAANHSPNLWLFISYIYNDTQFEQAESKALFDFPVLSPGQEIQVPLTELSGIVTLTWDAGVPMGFVNSGKFVVSAQWYDGDPFAEGQFVEEAVEKQVFYQARVTESPAVAAPEPMTFALVVLIVGLYMATKVYIKTGGRLRKR